MARLIIGENELLPGTQVITANSTTITPKDGLEVLLNISDVTPATVTLNSGTGLSQEVHVTNKNINDCSVTYLSDNGLFTLTLKSNQSVFFNWSGTYWESSLVSSTSFDGGTDFQRVDFNGAYEATLLPNTSKNFTAPFDGLLILRVYYHLYGAIFSIKINNNTVFFYDHNSAGGGQTAGPRNDVYFQFRVKEDDVILFERSALDSNTNYSIAIEAQFSKFR